MYRVSKDGVTYRLNDNGVAAYLFHSWLQPKESREATQEEIKVYDTAHKAIWKKVIDNMGLGNIMASKFSIYDSHIIQPITIDTLLRCIEGYDSSRAAFSTYASRSLYRSFQRYLRYEKKLYSMPPDDEYGHMVKVYGERRYHKTVLDSVHLDFIKHDDKDVVQFLMNGLDEYDRRMLSLVYWCGLSMQQLADIQGVAKSTAWIDIQRILTSCRRILQCEKEH